MDEAKSLVHMALTAMFAALIIAAVIALITVGNLMWSAFSRQNAAQRRMQEYSKYSAFDGTEVRGQDVISLLHDTQGSPFVIIADSSVNPISVSFDAVEAEFEIDSNFKNRQSSDITSLLDSVTLSGTLSSVRSIANKCEGGTVYDGNNYESRVGVKTFNFTAPDDDRYNRIQEWFLARGNGGYLKYKSYLLYDDASTTDIVGILLVEQPIGG